MIKKYGDKNKYTYTRAINPKFGLLGLFGVMGFLGFLPQIPKQPDIIPINFPLFFFSFFGFFGFYYEGKMSNTLMDERFEKNSYRAKAIANKSAFMLILGVAMLCMSVIHIKNPQTMLNILIATLGLAFGLLLFLQQYLLYRFENEE